MRKRASLSVSVILRAGLVVLGLTGQATGVFAGGDSLGSERQRELKYLLQHDCGSCHGMRLKGGLGPSLLPDALQGKPAPYLKHVITNGLPGSAMPPWGKLLSEQDIDYLVELLTSQSESALEVNQ